MKTSDKEFVIKNIRDIKCANIPTKTVVLLDELKADVATYYNADVVEALENKGWKKLSDKTVLIPALTVLTVQNIKFTSSFSTMRATLFKKYDKDNNGAVTINKISRTYSYKQRPSFRISIDDFSNVRYVSYEDYEKTAEKLNVPV